MFDLWFEYLISFIYLTLKTWAHVLFVFNQIYFYENASVSCFCDEFS